MSTFRRPASPLVLARREAFTDRVAHYIEKHPGCTANQLQGAIGSDRNKILQSARDLTGAGLVIRTRDPADRRVYRYVLAAGYQPPALPAAPPPPQAKACERCGGPLPPRKHRFCSDTCRARKQKAERVIENSDYASGLVRQIARMGIRASDDLAALTWLATMTDQAREALALAVDGCRVRGHSDAEIGQALGISRQAVWKRFHRQPKVDTETTETEESA